MQLPLPLPDLFVSTDGVRSGVHGVPVDVDPRFQVRAADATYARTALSTGLLDAIAAFGATGQRVDLSVDGQQLVAVGWAAVGVARKSNSRAKSSTIDSRYAPTIPSSHLM
jgi:hypothetical protein